jgi:hypothetical protein
MLNQTNVGANNNKFYVIQARPASSFSQSKPIAIVAAHQVIEQYGQYYAWNRWGRVGPPSHSPAHRRAMFRRAAWGSPGDTWQVRPLRCAQASRVRTV